MTDEYKEAKQGDVVKLEKGQALEGTFVNIEPSQQYKDSFAFRVNVNGEVKVTFVNNIVKDLIESNQIKQGQAVKLIYNGKKKSDKGMEYKTYTLLYK